MPFGLQQVVSGVGSATINGGQYTVAVLQVQIEGGQTQELDAAPIPRMARVGYVALGASFDDPNVKNIEWWKWVDFKRELIYLPSNVAFSDTFMWNLYPGTTLYVQLEYA